MFAKIQYYFLQKYENSDFITRQRVKILLRICLTLTFVILAHIVAYIIRGTPPGVVIPATISGLILIVCIALIKYGYYYIAAHTILVVSTSALWIAMVTESRITANIGISMYSKDAEDEQSLMKNADIAMYLGKEDR